MTPEITCIIYDMDGLLLDTEGIYTEVTQEIVSEYGKVFDWSIKEKIIGRRSIQAAQIIVESLDLPITPQVYLEARKDVLLERFRDTKALPGAKALTTHFFQRGTCITNKNEAHAAGLHKDIRLGEALSPFLLRGVWPLNNYPEGEESGME